ncbi:MAG: aspartyl protease family protein [Pseudohongiellaceae bacterium]|jgi:aspartyl protease family protein
MDMRAWLFVLVFSISLSCTASSANSVTIKGLFNGAALLIIDGQRVLLKKGKEKFGVKLITADSKEAVLEIGGKRQRVRLSNRIGGHYQQTKNKIVRVASKRGGHHWVRGQINGRGVEFLVDTGASLVTMNLATAKRLNIDYEKGTPSRIQTANGLVENRVVNLNKVTIGEITHYNIAASVSLDNALTATLLGNSFLSKINLSTDNGILIMEAK